MLFPLLIYFSFSSFCFLCCWPPIKHQSELMFRHVGHTLVGLKAAQLGVGVGGTVGVGVGVGGTVGVGVAVGEKTGIGSTRRR